MKLFIYTQIFLFLWAGSITAASRTFKIVEQPEITFRDFNSVVNMSIPETVGKLGFGWARNGFAWVGIEPRKGAWDWQGTDKLVLGAHAIGVQILPNLLYTVPWDESVPGNQFAPPRSIEDWEAYVEHVVEHYSRPPFDIRYFQIWNEPTREAGFWRGSTNRDFIDQVYIPAAKIIRRYGCRVVFGGWPDSNSIAEYDSLLAYHDAWKWTDILDIHYQGLTALQKLYEKWIKTGKCLGIWETEVGYTSDPDFLPNLYLTTLHWALQSDWKDPNQYKLFWYASWGAGKDGPNCLTMPGPNGKTVLTTPGIELHVMNEVLGGGPLADYSHFTVRLPGPPEGGGGLGFVMGFKVGNRRVIVFLLNRQQLQNEHSIPVKLLVVTKPLHVEFLDVFGHQYRVKFRYKKGQLMLNVPVRDMLDDGHPGKVAVGYLSVGDL